MLELIVYPKPKSKRIINNSPFCSKTEIFLKLAGLDYSITAFEGNPGQFPKSKLPVLKHNGQVIEDSTLIQKYLEKEFQISLDDHLSEYERSLGFSVSKMLENYLYWSLLYERWLIDKNWSRLKKLYFSQIPKLIRGPITNKIRKKSKLAAFGHGMGRHSDQQVLEFGKEAICSLSHFLGEKNYALGDRISSFDSTFYAFVSNILHSELGPELTSEMLKYDNLVSYDERMFSVVGFDS